MAEGPEKRRMKQIITVQHTQSIHHTNGMVDRLRMLNRDDLLHSAFLRSFSHAMTSW